MRRGESIRRRGGRESGADGECVHHRARKRARLERLIGIYEAKGGEASTSLGEARAALREHEAGGPAEETAGHEQQPMDEDDGGITL